MIIESTRLLTESQTAAVVALENLSFKEDALENHAFLSSEINFDVNFPCFYLGYEGEDLVAFLTTFAPISMEAEILAVTHPDHRRKGYFKTLLAAARAELLGKGISSILFAAEPKSKPLPHVIASLGNPPLERSEYTMSCSKTAGIAVGGLTFERVTLANRVVFTAITMEAFPDIEPNSSFISKIIKSPTRMGYIAYNNGVPIGVFDLNFKDEGTVYLYGVAVAKSYRGQGFGKALVWQALVEGLNRSQKMVLDVDSDNPVAFSLYKNSGFAIDFQVDYYRYAL